MSQPDLFSEEEMPFNLIQDEATVFDMGLEMKRRKLEAQKEKRQFKFHSSNLDDVNQALNEWGDLLEADLYTMYSWVEISSDRIHPVAHFTGTFMECCKRKEQSDSPESMLIARDLPVASY